MRWLYDFLAGLGYTHPLHPPFTHVTIGLVVGAFVFGVLGWFRGRNGTVQAARSCVVLAWVFLIPTLFFGFLDWQYRLGGQLTPIIRMKMALGMGLFIFLLIAMGIRTTARRVPGSFVGVSLICLAMAVFLGYLGGEIVFREKGHVHGSEATRGERLFVEKCSGCHFDNSRETKVGPGLAGLFSREALPFSGRPVTEENIRRQLVSPFRKMPSFKGLEGEDMDEIISYLRRI